MVWHEKIKGVNKLGNPGTSEPLGVNVHLNRLWGRTKA